MVAMGGSVEEGEGGDDVAEKVAGLLLLRLVPADSRDVAENAGKQRRSGAPASSVEDTRERERMSRRLSGVVRVRWRDRGLLL
jgi:hypothetical protein